MSKLTFSLEPSSIQHALCTLIIATLCYLALYYQPTPEAPWLLLSAILLSQSGFKAEQNWWNLWQTFFYLACGFIIAISIFILSLTPFIYKTAFTTLIIFSATYFSWRNREYYFAAFTLSLVSLITVYLPCDLRTALTRASLVFLGSLIVFALRFLFFFYHRSQAFYHANTSFFQKLKKVFQLIFYSAGASHSLFNFDLEESHFQAAWSNCLSSLETLKNIKPVRPEETTKWSSRRAALDRIFNLALSLGSLRYRLSDRSVLKMGQEELQRLLRTILILLNDLSRAKPSPAFTTHLEAFQAAIKKFEELYQSMLQTISKEPLVLLLFLQDLYALKEEFESLDKQNRGQA